MTFTATITACNSAHSVDYKIEAADMASAIIEADKMIEALYRNEARVGMRAEDWTPMSSGKRYLASNRHGRSVGEIC